MRYALLVMAAMTIGLTACGKENRETVRSSTPDLKNKTILMIIAKRNFRDEELEEPYTLLKQCGAKLTVASSTKRKATGMLGKVVVPDALITEVNPADYDCIVFIGGSGAMEYLDNRTAHGIAQTAIEKDKLLCAICLAPGILANAGVLKGKKATCFSSAAVYLKQNGAVYIKQDVVQDGKIITASGPTAAQEFARSIVKALERSE